MKRTILFSLLIAGLLLAGTNAFGWSGGSGMRGGQEGPRATQRMTDEQCRKIAERLREAHGIG